MSAPNKVKLYLRFNDRSKLALSIPLAECTTFAIRPLRWLRFLGFAIYGREGYLTTSMNGEELDYTAEIEARSYYFISDGEPDSYTLRSFLILSTFSGEPRLADLDAIDNRTSDASELSTERGNFRQRVIERDGTCVLTSVTVIQHCHACHLIPHSKGDSYMTNLFNHRGETYGLVGPLGDIQVNDIRNGILLHVLFHYSLDAGDVAFLRTPNFALAVDDIPYHQPPNAGNPATRLTLQHIQPSRIDSIQDHFAPHNSDARQPQDLNLWPPPIIVDHCYATAVLQAWGPKSFLKYLRANSKDPFYGTGVEGDDDEDEDVSGELFAQVLNQPEPPAHTHRYNTRSPRKAQAADSADEPTFADMFDLVMALWMRAAREGERRPPASDAADVADNENKIRTWLQSMEESTS